MRSSRLTAALTALALTLVGCSVGDDSDSSRSTSSSGATSEITFLTFETPNLPPQYWDSAIKRVTDKYPDIKVKKLVAPNADRTAYAKQLLASGQLPDVLIAVSAVDVGAGQNLYAWQPDELKEFLVPNGGAIDGKVYQLPANTQTIPNVYYRKSFFIKAGITTPPKSYQDLLDDSAKLKAKGIQPFVVGGGREVFPSVLPLTATVGTEVYKTTPDWLTQRHSDKVKFTDPAFVKAITLVKDLADKGYIDKKMVSLDYAATEQAFLKGRGAMYPMGSWFASSGDKSSIKDDIGVFSWPTADGSPLLPEYTGGGLSVNSHAKNLNAARRFALGFQLDKSNLDNSVHADALFPAIKGYTPPTDVGPVFQATFDLYKQHRDAGTLVNAFSWETGSDGPLAGLQARIWRASEDVIIGRTSPQKIAQQLDSEWAKAS